MSQKSQILQTCYTYPQHLTDVDQTYYCWAMSEFFCLPFTNASHSMHPSNMLAGIHSYLHELYCPSKSEIMYLCLL